MIRRFLPFCIAGDSRVRYCIVVQSLVETFLRTAVLCITGSYRARLPASATSNLLLSYDTTITIVGLGVFRILIRNWLPPRFQFSSESGQLCSHCFDILSHRWTTISFCCSVNIRLFRTIFPPLSALLQQWFIRNIFNKLQVENLFFLTEKFLYRYFLPRTCQQYYLIVNNWSFRHELGSRSDTTARCLEYSIHHCIFINSIPIVHCQGSWCIRWHMSFHLLRSVFMDYAIADELMAQASYSVSVVERARSVSSKLFSWRVHYRLLASASILSASKESYPTCTKGGSLLT